MPSNQEKPPHALPGTRPLTRQDDLALAQIKGMNECVERLVRHTATDRRKRTASTRYEAPVLAEQRSRFRRLLALSETRTQPVKPERRELGVAGSFKAARLRWEVTPGFTVAALCLEPARQGPLRAAIMVPDVAELPEDLAGLTGRLAPERQTARQLAEGGVLVLCPYLTPREHVGRSLGEAGDYLNWRRRLWKLATQVGRTLIGFEVDRVLACTDYLAEHHAVRKDAIVVGGAGQGALTAFYASAADERIAGAVAVNYFGPREGVWCEPVDRALWGQLGEFGDAEVAALIAPRRLCVVGRPQGADVDEVKGEFARAADLFRRMGAADAVTLDEDPSQAAERYAELLRIPKPHGGDRLNISVTDGPVVRDAQRDEIEHVCLRLVEESAQRRESRWKGVDTSSIAAYERTNQARREAFAEMIGLPLFPPPDAPMNVESRLIYDRPKFRSYEVTIPIYDGVFLYGVLSVPSGLRPGERRPAIVCHHGATGHCRYDIVAVEPRKGSEPYHAIGAEHASRGCVTFAPQGHFGVTAIRGLLQEIYRKAHSVGGTDFGLFVRMHQRAAAWLRSLPFVDGERIGFHGLSYGGYTALWVPPLVPEYKVVVCAGHFNDWAAKTTAPDHPTCYLWHNDDQMYNHDMVNRLNHSDLAALICPRPFMVEAGLKDAVTPKDWTDREYAKVAALYAALGIPDRTEIHWGAGGHQIFAERSYPFLDKWLPAR